MEPWLTGTLRDLPPVIAALLYSFQQAREDLDKYTSGLTDGQIWHRDGDIGSVGFHVRHIAGSVERLVKYASGQPLSEEQMQALRDESNDLGPTREELFKLLNDKLAQAEETIRSIDPATLADIREIGRKRTPVPLGVILVHISEHTQRHVGAAIVTAKLAKRQFTEVWMDTELR